MGTISSKNLTSEPSELEIKFRFSNFLEKAKKQKRRNEFYSYGDRYSFIRGDWKVEKSGWVANDKRGISFKMSNSNSPEEMFLIIFEKSWIRDDPKEMADFINVYLQAAYNVGLKTIPLNIR